MRTDRKDEAISLALKSIRRIATDALFCTLVRIIQSSIAVRESTILRLGTFPNNQES
ncbi:MAG: hypothetical protein K2X66_04680 [Cyanobacteria bacterium]|nr:hypothetical protein [Cyanobacteriota bacterium]